MNARTDVNRFGSIDQQLRFAIANKLLVQLGYGGSTRVVEPHDYGVQRGAKMLLAYQRHRTGETLRKGVSGWRLFDVSKINACVVLDEPFRGSRADSDQHHYVWDAVYARVA